MDAAGQEGVGGTPWSEAEVSAVVDSYFRMLASERAGVSYNKSENRRRLMTTVRRSEGSIERKLQNISAVLDLLAAANWRTKVRSSLFPSITGSRPSTNFRPRSRTL